MKWQIQRIADEGTAEPYVARLWSGLFEIRDILLRHLARDDRDFELRRRRFDDLYTPVLDAMGSARKHARRISELVEGHRAKIDSGAIVSHQANAVQIDESISAPLQEAFANFIFASVRAAKLHQDLLKYLGLDIGFLFAKEANFQARIGELRQRGQDVLAGYLVATRAGWSDKLINKRNDLEHEGWRLPDVRYRPGPSGEPQMLEPEVDGVAVSAWTAEMLPHVLAFVEDMGAYCVQEGLGSTGALADIPEAERDPQHKKRFYFTVPALQPEAQIWKLRYSVKGFPHS